MVAECGPWAAFGHATSSPETPAQAERRLVWVWNLEGRWVGALGQLSAVDLRWRAGATRTRMGHWRWNMGNMGNEFGQVSVGVLNFPLKLRPCVVRETAEDARV